MCSQHSRRASSSCSTPNSRPLTDIARNHTEQVLGKLGVSSRAAVGALIYGQG
jgi:hypothetical protein